MIIPVILGADLNAYSVARAFYEKYKVKSYAFAKAELGPIKYSRIIKFNKLKGVSDSAITDCLIKFANVHNGECYIVPCTDEYAEYVSRNSGILSENFICKTTDFHLLKSLTDKAEFYGICGKYNLPCPKTIAVNSEDFSAFGLPKIRYPIAIKPSVSSDYWHHPFAGMKKVYYASCASEASMIINKIAGAGYSGKFVLQEFIPGSDDKMRVLTTFSSEKRVVAACYGRVILEEHTPKGLGNHAAILTEPIPEAILPAFDMLNALGYNGFANLDIIYDSRDGKLKFLELNARQGRSNYYMTAAGINIAELTVNPQAIKSAGYKEIYWHTVPSKIVLKYADKNEKEKINKAIKAHGSYSSLHFKYDLISPARAAYVIAHDLKYYEKYRQYP